MNIRRMRALQLLWLLQGYSGRGALISGTCSRGLSNRSYFRLEHDPDSSDHSITSLLLQ
jgi:hypothetical protein